MHCQALTTTLLAVLGFLNSSIAEAAPSVSPGTKAPTEKASAKLDNNETKPKAKKRRKKQPITAIDYAQWERLGGEQLSHDGKWLIYSIARVDKERTLHLTGTKGGKKKLNTSFPQGEKPVFSDDSRWLAVTLGKSPAEIKKAAKADKKPPNPSVEKIQLRRLKDGETTEFEQVRSLQFSADSNFACLSLSPKGGSAKPGTGPGKALIIRNLESKTDTTFGNVVKHAWSDQGALLAMVVDSPSISNALQVFDPATGVLHVLDSSDQEYSTLTWRKDSMDLAAMREMKHGEKEDVSHVLLAWRKLDQAKVEKLSFEHAAQKSFPEKMYIASGGLEWTKNGKALLCDLKEWEKKPVPDKEDPDKKGSDKKGSDKKDSDKAPKAETLRESLEKDSNVEVWHSKDTKIMPKQKKLANSLKNPKRRSIWRPESGKFVQLGTELTEQVSVSRSGQHAVGIDRTPHERIGMFGPSLHDIYVINTSSGKRKRVLEAVRHQLKGSPNGRYILYLHKGDIWSYDIKKKAKHNLTRKLGTLFTDQEDDTLAKEKRPYGSGEWLTDSSAVLLYDRYDIWSIAPDGTRAVKLTEGAQDQVRHRLSRASYHEDDDGFLDPRNPLYIALYGDLTKKSGYGSLNLGGKNEEPGKLKRHLWDDKQISSLQQAKEGNFFTYKVESYQDSPDLFLSSPNLTKTKKITHTNRFQKKFSWGHSELVDYTNANGVALQGALTYPANYKKGRKYPMVVYIYEKRSQDLHRYHTPSETHPYNPAVFSAEGYFVFQPDIIYRPQEPGISAVECVVPAVEEVLKTGMIDKKRVGLIGHSWGAYQTAFIVTQTDLFAAGVAGAPLTDMMSMSVSVYWNSGETNAAIFTQSQGRMSTPFWRDPENYVRNSPIHSLDKLNTPLMIAFGDADGAVDFDQGVQMYNAARWAAKDDFIMLVYPGENHSLRKEENAVDYHYRILEWFDHYLKRAEPQKWITEGTSFLDRQKELEDKKEDPKEPVRETDRERSKTPPEKKKVRREKQQATSE